MVSHLRSEEHIPLILQFESVELPNKSRRLVQSSSEFDNSALSVSSEDDIDEIHFEKDKHDVLEINNCQAVIHIFKCCIGTGVLALPSAVRHSGYLLGLVAILVLSLINIYAMHLLLEVIVYLRSLKSKMISNLDYQKTVRLCFENASEYLQKFSWLHYALYFFVTVGQIGFLSSYHIFVAENTKVIIDFYFVNPKYTIPIWGYQLMYFVLLTTLLFCKTLDKLSYLCQVANILMATSLLISLVYCYQDPLPIKELPMIKISYSTLLSFGIVIFSFECTNIINPIENHMKNKNKIGGTFGVLNIASGLVLPIYLVVGFSGYWKFGDKISSSIILSIPLEPWYYMLCKPLYIVSIYISYALQGFVMHTLMWGKISSRIKNENRAKIADAMTRISIGMATTVLSISIPHFDLFISLIGALSGAAITLIFPSLCHAVMVYSMKTGRFWKIQLFTDTFIFAFGIIGCGLGTYSSIVSINQVMNP